MKLYKLFAAAAVILSFAGGNAMAAGDKTEKQAEIRKVTAASMEKFYKADPSLKAAVAKAPGYAVFTTYGLSFLVGGAGGKGLAHNNQTKKDTFMEMAQASAGVQIGASESETLIVFKTAKGLEEFVTKGWSGSGGGSIQAGAGGTSAGPAAGQATDAMTYTLTKNGLNVGIAGAGTKYWADKELN
jgi:lipid-binding SYLF domain-containing protein